MFFVRPLFLRVIRNARLFLLVARYLKAFAGYFLNYRNVFCGFVVFLLLLFLDSLLILCFICMRDMWGAYDLDSYANVRLFLLFLFINLVILFWLFVLFMKRNLYFRVLSLNVRGIRFLRTESQFIIGLRKKNPISRFCKKHLVLQE